MPERGASAVEFALIVLPLCYLVVAIMNYGMMLSFRQAISQSAAEGARAGAVTPAGGDVVDNAAAAVSQALGHGLRCAPPHIERGGSAVGDCAVTVATCANSTATCVSVGVVVDFAAARVAPCISLVPMPHRLHYTATSEVAG